MSNTIEIGNLVNLKTKLSYCNKMNVFLYNNRVIERLKGITDVGTYVDIEMNDDISLNYMNTIIDEIDDQEGYIELTISKNKFNCSKNNNNINTQSNISNNNRNNNRNYIIYGTGYKKSKTLKRKKSKKQRKRKVSKKMKTK